MNTAITYGLLAKSELNLELPVVVLKSAQGYYLGTANDLGPVSRESVEYFKNNKSAESALKEGRWSQRFQS